MDWGLEHTFGPGYFCEIGPRQETVGLPPYVTAHGTYISACLYRFVTTSVWDREISIFASIPSGYRNRRLMAKNVVCAGNITVTAEYSQYEVKAEISGNLAGYRLLLPVPQGIRAEDARLYINNVLMSFKYRKEQHAIEFVTEQKESSYRVSLS
jgi:hypothetical protein